MMTAKQAKNATNIEEAIAETVREIDLHIQVRAAEGFCYFKYNKSIPVSVINMLVELGYDVQEGKPDLFSSESTIISWGKPKKDMEVS